MSLLLMTGSLLLYFSFIRDKQSKENHLVHSLILYLEYSEYSSAKMDFKDLKHTALAFSAEQTLIERILRVQNVMADSKHFCGEAYRKQLKGSLKYHHS